MAHPVPIPPGALDVTDADAVRAETLVQALAQIFQAGTTGTAPTLATPATLSPSTADPTSVVPFVMDTKEKQLFYRQVAIACARALVRYASSTVVGITKLSKDPSDPSNPIALTAEDVSVVPGANLVPRARPDGTLDPAWVGSGPGPTPAHDSVFSGVCTPSEVVGDLVHIINSGKQVRRTSVAPVIGCIISKDNPTQCWVQTNDLVANVYTGLTPGQMYYLGTSCRPVLFADLPVGSEATPVLVQPVGFAIDSNILLMSPSTTVTRRKGG